MDVLVILTLAWTAVFVLALAASLTAIWLYLRSTASTLGEVAAALSEVERTSGELGARMEQLEIKDESVEALARTRDALREGKRHLDAVAGPTRATGTDR